MSSFVLIGNFCLDGGVRIETTKSSGTKSWHTHYNTAVTCSNGQDNIQANIRLYTTTRDILPNGTVAFVVAKAYVPPLGVVLLDCYQLIPFPGDPTSESYDDTLPNMSYTIAIGVGHVPASSTVTIIEDGRSRAFPVSVSEYVRDGPKFSTIQCVLDGNGPRWVNIHPPDILSCINFIGVCQSVTENGNLRVSVDGIAKNLAPHVSDVTAAVSQAGPSTAKKRKYSSIPSSSKKEKSETDNISDIKLNPASRGMAADIVHETAGAQSSVQHVTSEESVNSTNSTQLLPVSGLGEVYVFSESIPENSTKVKGKGKTKAKN